LFLFYAVFVWYLCFKHRRQWIGVLSLIAGLTFVAILGRLYESMIAWAKASGNQLFDGRSDGRMFTFLLVLEAAIVLVVGVFLLCLPRIIAVRPCRKCTYELSGLDDPNPTCPECGLKFAVTKPTLCPMCNITPLADARQAACSACAVVVPGEAGST
jgi:hypothetical protein